MRLAVVGHVEWVEFARLDHVPEAGEVVHASHAFQEPAGGGAVAAVELARLAGAADLYTALGDDALGARAEARLTQLGVTVHAARRPEPTRRALTLIDDAGERTIVTLGPRLTPLQADALPWERLAETDGVYFTAGDGGVLAAARQARVLVATPRARAAGVVPLDALVYSAGDPIERAAAAELEPSAAVVVVTRGAAGGDYTTLDGRRGTWRAASLKAPGVDAYGCGDSFAAALTYGLAASEPLEAALAFAAECGAKCLTRQGPYGA